MELAISMKSCRELTTSCFSQCSCLYAVQMESGRMVMVIVTVILLLVLSSSTSKVYYVTPSAGDPCSLDLHPCITLSQFAAKPSDYLESNTTLILLTGIHMLDSVLNVSNTDNFVLTSQASSTFINCNGKGRFEFRWVSSVRITALEFIGCGGNRLLLSEQLVIEDCVFQGKKNGGTAIELLYTNASILKTAFFSNKASYVNMDQNLTLGGALILTESSVVVVESSFINNTANVGGAIYGEFSGMSVTNVSFINSTFIGNQAVGDFGGALYFQLQENNSNSVYTKLNLTASIVSSKPWVTICGCNFSDNSASFGGGVLAIYDINLNIGNSQFFGNSALQYGGILIGQGQLIINIDNCKFHKNSATYGGVIAVMLNDNVHITAYGNVFYENSAVSGGVLLAEDGGLFTFVNNEFYFNAATDVAGAIVLLKTSVMHADTNIFFNNTASIGAVLYTEGAVHSVIKDSILVSNMINDSGGIIDVSKAAFLIVENTQFINNSANNFAGFIVDAMISTTVTITNSKFVNNSVGGSVIIVGELGSLHLLSSQFMYNSGGPGMELVQFDDSTVYTEDNDFITNVGSMYSFNSKVTFSGNNNFIELSQKSNGPSAGGAITAIQSLVVFKNESCVLIERNSAYNGGAIFASESSLYVYGQMTMTENIAKNSGGGVYLYQSGLHCFGCTLHVFNNTACNMGGGIQVISSVIKVHFDKLISHVSFENNRATKGGAVSFESNGNLVVFRYLLHKNNTQVIYFKGNLAVDGGAIYVNDDTLCLNSDYDEKILSKDSTECFFQVLTALQTISLALNLTAFNFEQNYAHNKGSVLFGGLLDRCTIGHFAEIFFKCNFTSEALQCVSRYIDGVNYIMNTSNIDTSSISSNPVRICFCVVNDFMPSCSYQPTPVRVKKGEEFTISLAAVDQVNHTLDAVVHSYLDSEKGGIGSGQLIQQTGTNCTNVTFSVTSPYDKETIIMYADGPCKDCSRSLRKLEVHFAPCSCPIGFQVNKITEKFKCDCECALELLPCLSATSCNSSMGTISRDNNCWIAYINKENNGNISSGYLIHMHCPLDYCQPPSSNALVNLNLPDGSDMQCAHNRHGKLCGSCKFNFSLSLGSSHCIPCSNNWPAMCASILVAAIMSGIIVVGLILVLNLTVAVGTLNGIIFYANIVAANGAIFLPSAPNFVTIFIAWLNLEIGFDTCFFKGMDAYWKTWLQFAYPAYVIFLVVVIICICEYSTRFAQILGKKNPVATLATLVLLSYTKVLQTIITALSVTTLNYPDGTREIVWLPDASVGYFHGKHIPLFIAAICILLIGTVYTVILFSWQWLLRYQDIKIFRWIRYHKLRLFLDPYHAPYTFKHRYWTGLLLLARVVLYIVSAVNIDNDPRVNLLAIGLIMSGLIALKGSVGNIRVNRQWPVEILDMVCYFNIISLTLVSLFCVETVEQTFVAAYVSVTITIALLMIVLLFHLFNESSSMIKVWRFLKQKLSSNNHRNSRTLGPTHTYLPAVLDREEDNPGDDMESEANRRNEHETCSDSDSGDIVSPLLGDVATY